MQVAGIRRVSEQPSSFVPANNPQRGSWFWVDAPALAVACRLPPDTPLVEVRCSWAQNRAAGWSL